MITDLSDGAATGARISQRMANQHDPYAGVPLIEAEDQHDPDMTVPSRMVNGGKFIYDAPDQVPALWGAGDDVLWAEGEPLLLTGPTGVGKTTLAAQIMAGRLGLLDEVLSYPATRGAGKVLYLAMDRPRQIQRALARLLRQFPRDVLDERLVVWNGPPPADLARHPTVLRAMADEAGADTVILDSLKDAAVKLSEEETGQGIARAWNHCVADGVEVLALHHQKKAGGGDGKGKPNSISDVYGSTWITAAAGSVVLLWGSAGDPIVELSHLKQPAADVGPLKIIHDHHAGQSRLHEALSILDLIRTPSTAREVAMTLKVDVGPATASDVEKARRRLENEVDKGTAARVNPPPGAPARHPISYLATTPASFTNSFTVPSEREGSTPP